MASHFQNALGNDHHLLLGCPIQFDISFYNKPVDDKKIGRAHV